MFGKTISYTDYNGVERKEKYYFNLSKAELLELELGKLGGMKQHIEKIVEAQDTPKLIATFKSIIMMSYGEKTADGKHFEKIDDTGRKLADKFAQTEAYSELFMELATDDKAAAEFINGIIPQGVAEEVARSKQLTAPEA